VDTTPRNAATGLSAAVVMGLSSQITFELVCLRPDNRWVVAASESSVAKERAAVNFTQVGTPSGTELQRRRAGQLPRVIPSASPRLKIRRAFEAVLGTASGTTISGANSLRG